MHSEAYRAGGVYRCFVNEKKYSKLVGWINVMALYRLQRNSSTDFFLFQNKSMVEFRVSLGLIVLTSVTAVPIETRLTYIRKIKQGQTVHKTSLQIERCGETDEVLKKSGGRHMF